MNLSISKSKCGIIFNGSNMSEAARVCGVSGTYIRKMIAKNIEAGNGSFSIKKDLFRINLEMIKDSSISFEDAINPIREEYINRSVEFFFANRDKWVAAWEAFYQKDEDLCEELRATRKDLSNEEIMKFRGRIYNHREYGKPSAGRRAYDLRFKDDEYQMKDVKGHAIQNFVRRQATIEKNLKSKGIDLDQLIKADLITRGTEFEIFFEDQKGITAHARAILAWGMIKAPHMRFICR